MKSIVFLAVAISGGAFVACVVNQVPPTAPTVASADPSTTVPTATATDTSTPIPTTTTTSTSTTTTTSTTTPTTTSTTTSTSATPAAPGSPAAFQACAVDSDCVAVTKVGCCTNGRMEAIATSQVDAYKASFVCPPPRPMCPAIAILETRQPECNTAAHLCEMVPIDKIACSAPSKGVNAHACPDGYTCKRKGTEPTGTCAK